MGGALILLNLLRVIIAGTVHIFQMDWKRYIIALANNLQSLLRPEVDIVILYVHIKPRSTLSNTEL